MNSIPVLVKVIIICGSVSSIPGIAREESSLLTLGFELSLGVDVDGFDSEMLIPSFSEEVSGWGSAPYFLLLMPTLAWRNRVRACEEDVLTYF